MNAAILIAGGLAGALLRVIVARLSGSDPRRLGLWTAELVVAVVLAAIFGATAASAAEPSLIIRSLGAGLTTYAAASGAFGFLAGRDLPTPEPWRWALTHFTASLLAGSFGFTASLLVRAGLVHH